MRLLQGQQPYGPPQLGGGFQMDFQIDQDQVRDMAQQAREQAREATEQMREQAREQARELGEQAREQAREMAEQGRQMAEQAREQARGVGVGVGVGIGAGQNFNFNYDAFRTPLALGQMNMAAPRPANIRNDNTLYGRGLTALDDHHYAQALDDFTEVVSRGGPKADGALYWKAYTLNKLGRRDDATAAIAQLRTSYASSRWLEDAKALELEVKQASGKPVSPSRRKARRTTT